MAEQQNVTSMKNVFIKFFYKSGKVSSGNIVSKVGVS